MGSSRQLKGEIYYPSKRSKYLISIMLLELYLKVPTTNASNFSTYKCWVSLFVNSAVIELEYVFIEPGTKANFELPGCILRLRLQYRNRHWKC